MRTRKARSQSQNHSIEPKVLDSPRRLEQETVSHDWQRKVPCTNPRDKAAGNRLSKLVKVSREGKKYWPVSSSAWQHAHKSNLIHIKILLQTQAELSSAFYMWNRLLPRQCLREIVNVQNWDFKGILSQVFAPALWLHTDCYICSVLCVSQLSGRQDSSFIPIWPPGWQTWWMHKLFK